MRLTEPYVDMPEAHIARAQAAQAVEDRMGALAAVDRALELRSGWEPAVLLKVQILQQAGAHTEALRVLEAEAARAGEPVAAPGEGACAGERAALRRGTRGLQPVARSLAAGSRTALCGGPAVDAARGPAPRPSCTSHALAAEHPQPDLIRLHLGRSPPTAARASAHASGSARSRARTSVPRRTSAAP